MRIMRMKNDHWSDNMQHLKWGRKRERREGREAASNKVAAGDWHSVIWVTCPLFLNLLLTCERWEKPLVTLFLLLLLLLVLGHSSSTWECVLFLSLSFSLSHFHRQRERRAVLASLDQSEWWEDPCVGGISERTRVRGAKWSDSFTQTAQMSRLPLSL